MHFIGIDLAWGERNPTGVAVLDGEGRLVHVSAVRTDDEIAEALQPYVVEPGGAVAGIDAPLIVTNASGNRPAESQLNRDFARFDAGTHPVNTARPEFAGEPRGARMARRLGLGIGTAALEVYPHAASVALFRLSRTLKYKHKPGRDVDQLRTELLRLTQLVEGLAAVEPPLRVKGKQWRALVDAVRDAERKKDLRTVEDQVDAVLCAYVALFATRVPDRVTVYGDPGTGQIITPTLPSDHTPGPRAPADVVSRYAAEHEAVTAAGERYIELITGILDDAGINYLSVTGRTKSVASFAAKAARRRDGRLLYPDPMNDVTDQIGVRVITYVLSDVDAVAELMRDQLVVKDDRDMGRETARQGRFGYSSRHLLIALDAAREPAWEDLRHRVASVQVRTVLQHAWAEFEHDIRYKGTVPDEHASDLDRRFTLAAGLLELADREFSDIRDRLRGAAVEAAPDDDPRIDPRELAAYLAGQYADAGWSRTDHYAWISGLLLELGVTSLEELGDVLRPVAALDLNARMDYKYPPGAVRRLDDALLAAFGERYVRLHGNAHRAASLAVRLEKLSAPASQG